MLHVAVSLSSSWSGTAWDRPRKERLSTLWCIALDTSKHGPLQVNRCTAAACDVRPLLFLVKNCFWCQQRRFQGNIQESLVSGRSLEERFTLVKPNVHLKLNHLNSFNEADFYNKSIREFSLQNRKIMYMNTFDLFSSFQDAFQKQSIKKTKRIRCRWKGPFRSVKLQRRESAPLYLNTPFPSFFMLSFL